MAKSRVHELAYELGLPSRQILDELSRMVRVAAFSVRPRPSAAPHHRRTPDRPAAPGRSPPRTCPHTRHRRRLPRHRARTAVLRTHRVPVQAALPADQPHRTDPAPAPALGADHPRRRQRLPAPADGQGVATRTCGPSSASSPLRRGRRRDDRGPRPRRPTPPALTRLSKVTAVWGW